MIQLKSYRTYFRCNIWYFYLMKNIFLGSLILALLKTISLAKCHNLAITEGKNVMIENQNFTINAISYDKQVKTRIDVPQLPTANEYDRIAELGFNTVKILLSYSDFEKENQNLEIDENLWIWVDTHINLAKENKLKLILTLQVPPGGHQSEKSSQDLWLNSSRQLRVMRYWYNVSLKYKDESTIIAYELLDDPSPNFSIGQWKQLAKNIINDIRRQSDKHIIILHNCIIKEGSTAKQKPEDFNFPYFPEFKNIIYSFDYWNNKAFTWQRVKGLPYNNDNEFFPDSTKYTYPEDLEIFLFFDDNTRIGFGTNELAFTEGKQYLISDSTITSILPVIYSDHLMPGFAFYNTIVIKEYSPTRQYLRDVSFTDPNQVEGWEIDTEDKNAKFNLISDYGVLLVSVIRVDRVETPTRIYNPAMRFVPKFGHYYSIGAHTFTQSINFKGESYLRFEFERSLSGRRSTPRTKEGIAADLKYFKDWSEDKNVPIMISEYGTSNYSFKRNRGGDNYLSTFNNILKTYELNACFSSFDSQYFGIYSTDKKGKMNPKKHQIEVWKNKISD